MLLAVGVLVGVLNFAAGDNTMPYAIAPTAPELRTLGTALAHDLRAAGTPAEHLSGTCGDAVCARRIGAAHHASSVIFSTATRHLAMIWSAQASVVNVATGRVSGPYDVGYKGDFDSIRAGLDTLAAALVPAVDSRAIAHLRH